jgi:hypothetical protein
MKKIFFVSLMLTNFAFAQSSRNESVTGVSTTSATSMRNFQFYYKNETSSILERNQKTGGGATTDNQFKATYLIDENVRFGFLISAKTDIAGQNEAQSNKKWIGGDLAAAVETSFSGFLGSDKTLFEGRMYFPTSQTSINKKQDFQLRADVNLPYTINNVFSAGFK